MAAMRRAVRARGPVMALVLGAVLVLGAAAGSLPDICRLPKVVGRCRAAFPRWWYNTTSQACQLFTFGGCKGNANNFLTEDKCFQKCTTDGDEEATETPGWLSTKEYCAKPQDVGPCRASFPRWYFDMESQTCKKFTYGGCGGNKNNHVSEGQCLKRCSGAGDFSEEPAEFHPHLFSDPLIHSTRAVVLAVLLAIMAAILLGSMVVFFVKICRKNQPLSLGAVWNTLDDKEYLMSNAYTL